MRYFVQTKSVQGKYLMEKFGKRQHLVHFTLQATEQVRGARIVTKLVKINISSKKNQENISQIYISHFVLHTLKATGQLKGARIVT